MNRQQLRQERLQYFQPSEIVESMDLEPQENMVTVPQENIVTVPQENLVTEPQYNINPQFLYQINISIPRASMTPEPLTPILPPMASRPSGQAVFVSGNKRPASCITKDYSISKRFAEGDEKYGGGRKRRSSKRKSCRRKSCKKKTCKRKTYKRKH
jgi:hypothetical protein